MLLVPSVLYVCIPNGDSVPHVYLVSPPSPSPPPKYVGPVVEAALSIRILDSMDVNSIVSITCDVAWLEFGETVRAAPLTKCLSSPFVVVGMGILAVQLQ